MTTTPCSIGASIVRERKSVPTCAMTGRPLDGEGVCLVHFSLSSASPDAPFARREAAEHLRLGRHYRDRGYHSEAAKHFLCASNYYTQAYDGTMAQVCMDAYADAQSYYRRAAPVNISALVD